MFRLDRRTARVHRVKYFAADAFLERIDFRVRFRIGLLLRESFASRGPDALKEQRGCPAPAKAP
jgi:hypothetical protein